MLHREISECVIGAAFEVHNQIGAGFLEKVYENALKLELELRGVHVEQQRPVAVMYKQTCIGEFVTDLFVEKKIICEIKANQRLLNVHEVQLVNYLAATGIDVGLLINFGSSVTVKRKYRAHPESC